MNRKVILTDDGSSSLLLPDRNEQYHSKYGAVQEANHVFIQSGLDFFVQTYNPTRKISILEVGLGTGLNTLLTDIYAETHLKSIKYTGLEAYPLKPFEWKQLNYPVAVKSSLGKEVFGKIHTSVWEKTVKITPNFELVKHERHLEDFSEADKYDLIYFDAFGPAVQPELWEKSIFEALFHGLRRNGILVTYSAKGSVRRQLKAIGFSVEKIPGPPGKREMIRAVKR